MGLFENLKDLDVNIEEGLDRFMGNASLYKRMIGKFVTMMESTSIQSDFDSKNYTQIMEKAHSIKGVAGNLSISPLYKAYSDIVTLLRNNQPEKAKEVFDEILPIQTKILDCIKKNI